MATYITFHGSPVSAGHPRCDTITIDNAPHDPSWVPRFRLQFFTYNIGRRSQQIFIARASNPDRILIRTQPITEPGFTQLEGEFWTAVKKTPGEDVMVSVAEAQNPTRSKVEIRVPIGGSNAPEDVGWKQKFSFFVDRTAFN